MAARVWGLAGKYCAGKNRAGLILQEEGCVLVDADKLGHAVLEEESRAVAARFGRGVLDREGRVNRKALGALVFRDRRALKDLEGIVHPPVIQKIEDIINDNPERIVVINAALLFSSGLYRRCGKVLWITAPLVTRIIRGLKRDHLSLWAVLRRIRVQRKLSPQHWRKDVDIYIIPNPGKEEILIRGLRNFLEREK